MIRQHAPQEILDLAHARREARAERNWTRADEIRAAIEAAGWMVVDRGVDFELRPAHPPDLTEPDRVRYGSSASVPSRLSEPSTAAATVILIATDWPEDLQRALTAMDADVPAGTQLVVVANAPSAEQEAMLGQPGTVPAGDEPEVVWTSARLGHAAALNAGIRRSIGRTIVLLDSSVEPRGDVVTPLVTALEDPTVGVAGPWGLASSDLRQFQEAETGDVAAIQGYCQAFRRADYVERGPLDEHFRFYRNLDIWWSLVLRDEGEGSAARTAIAVPDLPVTRHLHREFESLPTEERDRLSKRNFYRIIDRFGNRRDLL